MTLQGVLVALIVPLCALYAAWLLMGVSARRRVAQRLLALRWPAALEKRLSRHAADASACGCDGCDAGGAQRKPGATVAVVQVHRRGR